MEGHTQIVRPINLDNPDWSKWKQIFNIFLIAMKYDKEEENRKIAILLHCMGEQCLDIYNTFEDAKKKTYDAVVQSFDNYFVPKINLSVERHKFFSHQQGQDSLDTFLTKLKKLASSCDFGDLKDSLIRDIFICNMDKQHSNIRQKLLSEYNIELDKMVNMYKSMELSLNNTSFLEKDVQVAAVQRQSGSLIKKTTFQKPAFTSYKKPDRQQQGPKCDRCGQVHRFKCPASNKQCMKCYKLGHFAHMCRTPVNVINM